MLYLIGGPPRCGKTELASRPSRVHGIRFVSLDLLWSVVEVARPEWRAPMPKGIDRLLKAASLFEPFLESAARHMSAAHPRSILEGDLIRPAEVLRLSERLQIAAVFVLRSHVTRDEVMAGDGRSWLARQPDELIDAVVDEIRAYSAHVARECRELGLPAIEVRGDFAAALSAAASALTLLLAPESARAWLALVTRRRRTVCSAASSLGRSWRRSSAKMSGRSPSWTRRVRPRGMSSSCRSDTRGTSWTSTRRIFELWRSPPKTSLDGSAIGSVLPA